ncbi:formylglycine-generating enzyme family protein [Candidatus Poribacteria bacterium]|nr:formylglycine-generating enzyme family protein [Candidatus Poribacteria bacterium]
MILNQARDILCDINKRNEYITNLLQDESEDYTIQNSSTGHSTNPNEIQTSGIPSEAAIQQIIDPVEIDIPSEMVLIPSGVFLAGLQDKKINESETSSHNVYLNGFLIDKYPVTNSEFSVFLSENELWQKYNISKKYNSGKYLSSWNGNSYPKNKGDDPVVGVSWYAAMAYAKWIEKRLPTDIEWEKAARGGLTEKTYPWGEDITNNLANYGMRVGSTTPVGTYPPNEYGVYDIVGNVWEWCLNQYQENSANSKPNISIQEISDIIDSYLEIESDRVLRGGSWASSEQALSVGYRGFATPNITYYSYGFRCVKDIHS